MTRLRSNRFRNWILPALLGALVLRALIPAAFMPAASGDPMNVESTLCSSSNPDRQEKIKVPGEDHHRQHCEFCVLPMLGLPLAHAVSPAPMRLEERAQPTLVSQIPDAPLARTQSARGPPRI